MQRRQQRPAPRKAPRQAAPPKRRPAPARGPAGRRPAPRQSVVDRAKAKQEEIDNRSTSSFHDIRKGKRNWFILLPPWTNEHGEPAQEPWKEVLRHGLHVCPKAMLGKPCRLCDEVRKQAKKGNEDFVDEWKLGSRGFFNAVRREDLKAMDPENVKALALSPAMFRGVIEHITEEEMDITDPVAAVPIGLKKTGEGKATRYNLQFGAPMDISRYLTNPVLDACMNLDTFKGAKPATNDEMLKAINKALKGSVDEDDGYEDAGTDDDTSWEEYGDGTDDAQGEYDEGGEDYVEDYAEDEDPLLHPESAGEEYDEDAPEEYAEDEYAEEEYAEEEYAEEEYAEEEYAEEEYAEEVVEEDEAFEPPPARRRPAPRRQAPPTRQEAPPPRQAPTRRAPPQRAQPRKAPPRQAPQKAPTRRPPQTRRG